MGEKETEEALCPAWVGGKVCGSLLAVVKVGRESYLACNMHGLVIRCYDCHKPGFYGPVCRECREKLRERILAIKKGVRAVFACKRCSGRGEYEQEWEPGGDKVWARCDCRKTLEEMLKGRC